MTVLDDIIVGVREDMAQRQNRVSMADLARLVESAPKPINPLPLLKSGDVCVIAEVKRKSPSKGELAEIQDPAGLASAYEAGGAHIISVLTEQRRFNGTLADLDAVRAKVKIPILRKDFIVSEFQLMEARAHAADLALLIVAALNQTELSRLIKTSYDIGLTPLVEVHDAEEVKRAIDAGAEIIGVNNRDLKTLQVNPMQFMEIAPLIPDSLVKIAESGIKNSEDVLRYAQAGANAVLVGEALVTGNNPQKAVEELVMAGKATKLG